MELAHFEALAPVCPSCRLAGRGARAIGVHKRIVSDDRAITEGSLVCGERSCQSEFPIIDGIPFIVPNVAGVVSGQLDVIRADESLSSYTESLLGDAAGPESAHERIRYQVSSYSRSHYADLDPERPLPRERTFKNVIDAAIATLGEGAKDGLWLDCGCGPGRSAFELADATGARVLGIDLNVGMLKSAHRAKRGRVSHPLRRVGLVYDRSDFPVEFASRDLVDFWACDVLALPFDDGHFAGALSLNVLDCVSSPLGHLRELGRVLADSAPAAIASPFDWSTAATPIEGWIGGHSGRAPHGGRSEVELARLLASGDPAGAQTGLVIDSKAREATWEVYVHERASMRYQVHVIRARRAGR